MSTAVYQEDVTTVAPAGQVQIGWLSPTSLYVRVTGLGAMYTSAGLASFLDIAVRQGCRDVTVDLRQCDGMDSTFMGILAGAAQALSGASRGGLSVVNANRKCRSLLEGLGLNYLVNIREDDVPCPVLPFETLPSVDAMDFQDRLELLRRAHEQLASISDANRRAFEPFLKEVEKEKEGR